MTLSITMINAYEECHDAKCLMLSVTIKPNIMLSFIMLSVVLQNVIMLNVAAPFSELGASPSWHPDLPSNVRLWIRERGAQCTRQWCQKVL
jgi:hypothetical protein